MSIQAPLAPNLLRPSSFTVKGWLGPAAADFKSSPAASRLAADGSTLLAATADVDVRCGPINKIAAKIINTFII